MPKRFDLDGISEQLVPQPAAPKNSPINYDELYQYCMGLARDIFGVAAVSVSLEPEGHNAHLMTIPAKPTLHLHLYFNHNLDKVSVWATGKECPPEIVPSLLNPAQGEFLGWFSWVKTLIEDATPPKTVRPLSEDLRRRHPWTMPSDSKEPVELPMTPLAEDLKTRFPWDGEPEGANPPEKSGIGTRKELTMTTYIVTKQFALTGRVEFAQGVPKDKVRWTFPVGMAVKVEEQRWIRRFDRKGAMLPYNIRSIPTRIRKGHLEKAG